MTDIVLFDERGRRVPKATLVANSMVLLPGWVTANTEYGTALGWSFIPECRFRAAYCAKRQARCWRVIPLGTGEGDFYALDWARRCATSCQPEQRRFPNIASVEVYLRTICAHG